MAANKTFQVSRKSLYKRDKPCSPLASLNRGGPVGARPLSKHSPVRDHPGKQEKQEVVGSCQSQQTLAMSDQENIIHVQWNSSSHLLTEKLNCSSLTASPDACVGKPDNKDLVRLLNKTLSPIGTPERFKKIMPHVYSDSPLSPAAAVATEGDADSALAGNLIPSLKDALAIIDSDLSYINSSPKDTNSSCSFTDSLNSRSGGRAREIRRETFKTSSDGPSIAFVAKTVTTAVQQPDKTTLKAKKFVSVTVTKGKAPVKVSSSSGRKVRRSRRRLLEKTLELHDDGSCESAASSPSLPIIELNVWEKSGQESQLEESSFALQHQAPPTAATAMSPPAAAFPVSTSSLAVTSKSPLRLASKSPFTPDDVLLVSTTAQGKKRKSEELVRNDRKFAGRSERVKRSRVAAAKVEHPRPIQEKRSVTQRQQARSAGEFTRFSECALVFDLHCDL